VGGCASNPTGGARQGKTFFFEKKNQKTFTSSGAYLNHHARSKGIKSFLLLFFKKEVRA
jgi:hypothetical protein